MRKIIFLNVYKIILVSLGLAIALPLIAADSGQINYQARLLDSYGRRVNGTVDLSFKIYDAVSDGNLLWSETQSGVVVQDGVYSVVLGSQTAIPASVFAQNTVYLELGINGETMTPRQQITASAYSLVARTIMGSNVYENQTSGYVGVGTTNPAVKLDVSGTVQATGFKMPTGATANYVLASDANGVGTWQPSQSNSVYQLQEATNSLQIQATALQGATGALNTATNTLQIQVTALQGATSTLNNATSTLNTAVSALNANTTRWDNAVVTREGNVDGTLTITYSNLYYFNSLDGKWWKANATNSATAKGLLGLALGNAAGAGTLPSAGLLLNGCCTNAWGAAFTAGSIIYMDTNAGALAVSAPTGTNNIVRIVGYAINTTNIYFNPDRTYIEILGQ